METRTGNSRPNKKQSSEKSKSATEEKRPAEKEANTSVFVNYAAIAWHESRRKWIGDQRLQRMAKDPIISWSTAYEDLLSTNECFPEPIPLTRGRKLIPTTVCGSRYCALGRDSGKELGVHVCDR